MMQLKRTFACYFGVTMILLKSATCRPAETNGPGQANVECDHLVNISLPAVCILNRGHGFSFVIRDSVMGRDETLMCVNSSNGFSRCSLRVTLPTEHIQYTVFHPCMQTRPQIIDVFSGNRAAGTWTQSVKYRLRDLS